MRSATAALLAIAAGVVAGCGADDEKGNPIPAAAAAELEKRLDSVQGRFDFGGGACGDIPEDQTLANQTIQSLPESVDPDVRAALQDGFDRLFQLTEQCDEEKGQETEPEPEPLPTETEEQPTETEQQPTETQEEPTETEEQPPTEPGPPEEQPGDGGAGGGPPTEDEG